MSTILVVGGTGLLGSDICKQLTDEGKSVRALVRSTSDPAKVEKLKSMGVEIVQGDVRDQATLDEACKGVDVVISTVSSMPFSYQPGVNDIQTTDVEGVLNLIEAAKANHVSRFIYTSFSGNVDQDFPLQNAKRQIEQKLMESGLDYTILRPSCFMEVWLGPAVGFDGANGKVVIYGNGQNPLSWIAVHDVTQFAVAAIDHPAAKNAVLELGGPEKLTPLDVVRCFEQSNGRPIELQFVPEEALAAQQAAATDPMQQSFSALMRFVANGDPIEMSGTVETFAIRPVTVEEYVKRVLSAS
jgi:NADH dehydrogenase